MARQSEDDTDKALWLTLAQSWVRLAEHVAQTRPYQHEDLLELESSEEFALASPDDD